ncbi:hypothetical protein [Kitasatospora sp. NPDC088134]|uniref:hypothetical protein n=1 Tax=Kitasatospora sp. NPDC088134 TaxID=3364071 RepID=UPI00382ECC9A
MPTTDTTTLDERAVRITGGQRLVGTATVQGSKNTALHLYAATILADDPLTLIGAPEILDTGVVVGILHRTGTRATVTGDEFATRPADSYFPVIPDDLGRRIRTTAVMAGALLARSGKVTFPTPGGDAFCTRHIDRHLAAMEAAGADVELTGFPTAAFPDGLVSVFADAGIRLDAVDGGTTVSVPAGPRAVQMATGPHPGFPTDVQPQLTAFLTQAEGTSRIDERIYPQRDTHLPALAAFGAAVNASGPVITARGRSALTAADVAGADIRAATALVIAALAAEGSSTIRGMYHLRRGYGSLLPKLAALGADLTIDQEQP